MPAGKTWVKKAWCLFNVQVLWCLLNNSFSGRELGKHGHITKSFSFKNSKLKSSKDFLLNIKQTKTVSRLGHNMRHGDALTRPKQLWGKRRREDMPGKPHHTSMQPSCGTGLCWMGELLRTEIRLIDLLNELQYFSYKSNHKHSMPIIGMVAYSSIGCKLITKAIFPSHLQEYFRTT